MNGKSTHPSGRRVSALAWGRAAALSCATLDAAEVATKHETSAGAPHVPADGKEAKLGVNPWATENTREALWDAMKRKEVYGTSGTRMTVRFFGGWDFTPQDARGRSLEDAGYAKGEMSPEVPMTQQERAWTSPIWYTPGQ